MNDPKWFDELISKLLFKKFLESNEVDNATLTTDNSYREPGIRVVLILTRDLVVV